MADKRIDELPEVGELLEDALLVVFQQGTAQASKVKLLADLARGAGRDALDEYVKGAGFILRIGPVVTGEPGTEARVENIGTAEEPVLKLILPRGEKGDPGGVTSVNERTGAVVLPREINGVAFDGADPITVYDDTKATDIGIVSDCNQAFNNRRPANLTWWQWNRDTVNSPKSSGLTTYIAGVGYTYYSGSEWGVQVAWDGRGSAFYRARLNNNDWEPWRRQGLDAYPVGSYYLSSEPTSPASLFGGTWTQIEGRFILTAGGGYAAGSIGGAASVVSGGTALTVDQIAAHVHSFGTYTSASAAPTSAVTVGITGYADVSRPKSGLGMTDVTGGGQPHAHTVATMPPYIVAYCWRRVA